MPEVSPAPHARPARASDTYAASPNGTYTAPVARGDGRLNHDLDPQERGPQDACGVFGVWAPDEEVAKLTYFGLYALQHRGQESAGMAVSPVAANLSSSLPLRTPQKSAQRHMGWLTRLTVNSLVSSIR